MLPWPNMGKEPALFARPFHVAVLFTCPSHPSARSAMDLEPDTVLTDHPARDTGVSAGVGVAEGPAVADEFILLLAMIPVIITSKSPDVSRLLFIIYLSLGWWAMGDRKLFPSRWARLRRRRGLRRLLRFWCFFRRRCRLQCCILCLTSR